MATKKQINPVIAVIVIGVLVVIVMVIYSLIGKTSPTKQPLGGQEGMSNMKQMMQQKMKQGGSASGVGMPEGSGG